MRIHILLTSDATSVSETFFRKTIDDFQANGWEVIIVSGKKRGARENTIYTGFAIPSLFTRVWKLMAFLEKFPLSVYFYDKIRWGLIRDSANRRLRRRLKNAKIEFLLVEYVESAVKASKFLNDSEVPFCVCAHGYDASQMLASSAYCEVIRGLRPEFILAASEHLKRRLVLTGVDEKVIYVQPVDAQVSNFDSQPADIDFLSIGRFVEKKCPIALVHAMELVVREFPEAKMIMVGDGPLWLEAKTRVVQKNLSKNIELTGALSHDEALKMLNRSKVFVQHSVTSSSGDQEGYPTAISEAMLAGVPVISTRHSGITEAVVEGETGLLVQEYDYVNFGQAMIKLLRSEGVRHKMGERARERALRINPPGKRVEVILKLMKNHD